MLVHEPEELADVPLKLVVETLHRRDAGVAFCPQAAMAGLEEMKSQLFLADEMFKQCLRRTMAGSAPNLPDRGGVFTIDLPRVLVPTVAAV
jgi:hypothetical protein